MANMFGNEDWLKRAGEIYNETEPANSTDSYLDSLMGQYGIKPQEPDDASIGGYLNSVKRGLTSGATGVGSGIAYLTGADTVNKYLDEVTAENARKRDFDSIFSMDYATSPEGLTYDVANMGGSMAALAPAALALPESAAAGAAGLAARGLGRFAGQRLGTWAASKAGQEALKLGARGMVTSGPEGLSEWGKTAQQAEAQGSENPRLDTVSDFAGNMAVLPASNALEYMTLGGKLFRPAAKAGEGLLTRALKAPARALPSVAANAAQNGTEELLQQSLSDNALGNPVGNPLNPYAWTDEQRQAFEVGMAGGGVLAGAGSGARALKSRPAPIAEGIEDTDLSKTDANLVGGVNDLNSWAHDMFGKDLIVSGGYRNAEHNAEVNGSPTSYHLYGEALDVDASNFTEDERKQIEAMAREMGFNSNGENMYHDKGTGLHFHLILPEGAALTAPAGVVGRAEAADAEVTQNYEELPAEIAARNAQATADQLDRGRRLRGFVTEDSNGLAEQQRKEDAAAAMEIAASPVDAYLAEQEQTRNELMGERWDEAANRSGFMPQSYYDDPVNFYLNQQFLKSIANARSGGSQAAAGNNGIDVQKKYLRSDAARGLRGLERDTVERLRQMYPDDLQGGWKQERQNAQKQYDAMLAPVIDELKAGMKQGVEVIRPDGTGGYRESRNAPWYRDFYRQNKRPPTQAELKEIAYGVLAGERSVLPSYQNNSAESAAYFADQKGKLDRLREQLNVFDSVKSRVAGSKVDRSEAPNLVTPRSVIYTQAADKAAADLTSVKTTPRRQKLSEQA